MAGPPKDRAYGELMGRVVFRGRLPFAVVDFPRYDEAGAPVAQVYVRPLTQLEQDQARANAAAYIQRTLGDQRIDPKWKPEELEDNAVVAEILAVACRDPADPTKKFFEHGVMDTRDCTTEELAILFNEYNKVREKAYPNFREMSEAECMAWVRALEEDAAAFPFSRISRSRLEMFCVWAARSLNSLVHQLAGIPSK